MKRRLIVASTALAICVLALGACRATVGPQRVVDRFFRAMNDKDINVLLSCIDPKQERMFRAASRLIEKFSGGRLPPEDLLELLPGLNQLLESRLTENIVFTNTRTVRRRIAGDTAEFMMDVSSRITSKGVRRDQRETVRLVLRKFEDAGWRIVEMGPATAQQIR